MKNEDEIKLDFFSSLHEFLKILSQAYLIIPYQQNIFKLAEKKKKNEKQR
jgi:hypothetical protein